MKSLRTLSKQEIKIINNQPFSQFNLSFPSDLRYYLNDRERLFVVNSDFTKVDERKLIIDRVGLYVAEVKDKEIRLSKEGAQYLGEMARKSKVELKNTVELTDEELKLYFKGDDLDKDLDFAQLQTQPKQGELKQGNKKISSLTPPQLSLVPVSSSRMIILTYHHQIIGCTKYKEKKIHNYHPKQHRGEVII